MTDNLSTKIALSMIVRGDGEDDLKMNRALESIASHVDGIYITITGPKSMVGKTEKVLKKYGANISYNESLYEITTKEVDFMRNFFGYEPEMKVGDKIFI